MSGYNVTIGSTSTNVTVGYRPTLGVTQQAYGIVGPQGDSYWALTSAGIHTLSNVGIGTTNPTSKLTVQGNVLVSGIVTATSFSGNATSATYATSAGIATYSTSSGIATYSTNAGIATYATNAGVSTYATSSGIATYSTSAGIATYSTNAGVSTYATSSGIATYATNAGTSTSVIGGIASVTQLNVSSGITTVGFLTATNVYVSGVTTSNAYLIGASQVISSARQLQNIASLDAITTATIESAIANAPNTFTDLQVTGVSTFTNGPVLIGTGTSTGTASQRLQVTGGGYVSGSVGIGTTNPQTALDVRGAITIGVGTVGINSVFSTTDIQSWYYTNKSKLVSGDDTAPSAVYVGASGTAMFIVGDTNNRIIQYTLSTPYDVSTAGAAVTFFSTALQDTNPTGIDFNPTGTKMFISGQTGVAPLIVGGEYVHEYSLSTAWTVSTAGYTTSFNVTAQDTVAPGVTFGNSGSKMYVVGATNDAVYQYSLSTPYSLASGVTYDNISLALGTNPFLLETNPTDISFNSTGTVLWIVGSIQDRIYEFRLGTAWNISTAVFYDDVYIGYNETVVTGLHVIPEQNVAYIVGNISDTVFQYSTNTPAIEIASSGISSESSIVLNNETRVKDKLYVKGLAHFDTNIVTQGNIQVDGNATVSGNLTVSGGTITLSGATGSNIVLGTNQTTATLIIGGATQTGVITLGQATTTQTVGIATGVTASGSTKTINLGTGGASGSFTSINIGPTTGVGTVTVNSGTNLGIGTARATSTLHVAGTALITGISTVGLGTTSTPPSNSQMSFELTSDTNLRIKVRGTDGVLRSANITLA